MLKYIFLPLFILFAQITFCQVFEWKAGFTGIADNREYFNTVTVPQTIFGSRVTLECGLNVDKFHQFRVGFNYLYEYGSTITSRQPDPVIYYKGYKEPLTLFIGAFPRKNLLLYPLVLLTDTLNYFRPNIEGMLLMVNGKWGYQNLWIDWTSRQTDTERETFLFGLSGRINKGILFFTHHLLMYHFAGSKIPIPDDSIRDNGGGVFRFGMDLSGATRLDSLIFSAGSIISFDRIRKTGEWQTPSGILSEINATYKGFGIRTLYYRGEGHQLLYGDGFYKADSYGRTDFYFTPINSTHVKGRFTYSLHFIEGKTDNSQSFILSIDINGSKQ